MTDSYDLIVIGAGIIGLSCAYHWKLDHPDAKILVLEKADRAASGDTSKSVGAVRNTFTSEVNFLLANSSIDFYSHVQRDLKFDLDLQLVGYLWLLTEKQHEIFSALEKSMPGKGIGFKMWGKEDLQDMIGRSSLTLDPNDAEAKRMRLEGISMGVQGVKCGTIGPELVAEFYKKELERLGVKILFNTKATSLILEPAKSLGLPGEPLIWQDKKIKGVRTGRGEMFAKTTLVAVGRWSNQLLDGLGIDSHIKTKKRQVFQVDSPEIVSLLHTQGFNEHGLLHFTILPQGGVYIRPARTAKGFWVGAADDLGRPFAFEENPQPEIDYFNFSILPILSRYFPRFSSQRPGKMWAGEYDINTFDANPCIFEKNGLIVVAGLSGSGIMKADSTGRIASALIDRKKHATLYGGMKMKVSRVGISEREVDPERFII